MGYTIRRWLSMSGMLLDDSTKTKTAEEAIEAARRYAGIFNSVINEDFKRKVMEMEPGETVKLKKRQIKLSIHVRRTK